MGTSIKITGVSKRFADFDALKSLDLDIAPGEFLALLGPSGSGKTTLLRIIAGLELADRGTVAFNGTNVSDRPARDRHVGFVFQHYALFRHMTVARNIAFGLAMLPGSQRPPRAKIAQTVEGLLHLVQLDGLGGRYPSQLSGGQRQRVALARALAIKPSVLLLDEPFGALDAKVRKDLRRWLRKLHDDTGVTTVFVTHDQEEAMEIADRVVVMNKGNIEQIGAAQEVYDNPAAPFVFDFLGNTNRIPVRAQGEVAHIGNWAVAAPGVPDGPALAFVRPHEFDLRAPGEAEGIEATVSHLFANGPILRIELLAQGIDVAIEAEAMRHAVAHLALERGTRVVLVPRQIKVFPAKA